MTDLSLWISVVEIGAFYAMVALAYLVVLESAGFFNFALGAYAMFAAMVVTTLVSAGIPVVLAVIVGLLSAIVFSIGTELVLIRPIQKRTREDIAALVAVTAALLFIQQVAATLMGRNLLPGTELFQLGPWEVGGTQVWSTTVLLLVSTVVCFSGVAFVMKRTGTGRMLRAVGSNEHVASTLGLPVNRVRLAAFVLGGVIAAIAGIVFAAKGGVSYSSAFAWTIPAFVALVIGGTGSVFGPLLGGMVLGMMHVFIPRWLGSEWLDYLILALALVFFVVKPKGVFARRVRT